METFSQLATIPLYVLWFLISIAVRWTIAQLFFKKKLYRFYLTDFKNGSYKYSLWALNNKEAQRKLITFFFLEKGIVTVRKQHYPISFQKLTGSDIAISNIFLHISQDRSFGRIITGIGTQEDREWFEKLLSNLNINLDENGKRRIRSSSPTI